MFGRWTKVMRALARADAARSAGADDDYHAALKDLHDAMNALDQGDTLARIAAWIVRHDARS